MPSVNLGRVSIVPKGEWSNSASYEKLDVVTYGGGSYIANKEVPAGTSLSTTEYWQLLLTPLSLGTVETVSASTGASAEIITTSTEQILNLSIPRGVAGNESIDDTKGAGDTDYVWSADKLWNEVNNLDIDINSKANAIKKTVSGDIVSFDDGVDNQYVKNLKVNMEPVQDLHGYDNPWPAGGGKNLVDYTKGYTGYGYNTAVGTIVTPAVSETQPTVNNNVVTFTGGAWVALTFLTKGLSSGTYHVHMNLTENSGSRMTIYIVDGTTNEILSTIASTSSVVYDSNQTVSKDGDYIAVTISSNAEGTRKVSDLQVESGSSYSSWSPYSNICPITGWAQANVTRTAYNVWGGEKMADDMVLAVNDATKCAKGTDTVGNYVTLVAGTAISYKNLSKGLKFRENTQYTFILKAKKSNTAASSNMIAVYTDGTYTNMKFTTEQTVVADTVYTYANVTTANKTIDHIAGFFQSGTTTIYYDETGIFEGVLTASNFVPYNGTTVTIDLDGTRYGGELNVTQGKMLVTMGMTDMGTRTWIYQSSYGYMYSSLLDAKAIGATEISMICSNFKVIPFSERSNYTTPIVTFDGTNKNLQVRNTEYTDVTAFASAMSGVQLCYKLAEPFTVQLTPTQITTLLNKNNIWADTGDILNLDYATDTKSYIQENAVIAKAPIITENTSGSIVTISDGAEDMPLESLNVNIEPVQDLHGYDAPWPAGGGKNKFDKDNITALDDCYMNNMTIANGGGNRGLILPCLPNQTYTLSVVNKNTVDLAICSFEEIPTVGSIATTKGSSTSAATDKKATVTTGASDAYLFVKYNNTNQTQTYTNQQILDGLMVELGSTATTYAPYSNICPISGWTEANVTRTRVNLFNPTVYGSSGSATRVGVTMTLDASTGYYHLQGTGENPGGGRGYLRSEDFLLKAGYYYVKAYGDPTGLMTIVQKNGVVISSQPDSHFTLTEDSLVNVAFNVNIGVTYNQDVAMAISTEPLPDTYQPSQGQQVTIPLGQTIYGGTLDVGAGTLRVTMGINTDLSQLTWNHDSTNSRFWTNDITDIYTEGTSWSVPFICSSYKAQIWDSPSDKFITYLNTNKRIYIKDTGYTDVTTFVNSLSGVQLCYELSTPTVITGLTPAILRTLLGTNNIWADTGAVDVQYRADTKLFVNEKIEEAITGQYINDKITSAVTAIKNIMTTTTNSMIAPKALNTNDLIIVNDDLYKVIENIPNEGNLVVNNNVQKITLAEYIQLLLQS